MARGYPLGGPASGNTAFGNLLKREYGPTISDVLNSSIWFLASIPEEEVDGEAYYQAVRTRRASNVGARGLGDNLPSSRDEQFEQMRGDVSLQYGVVDIERPLMKASKGASGAWINRLDVRLRTVVQNLKVDMERQAFGDGTGALAQVMAADDANNRLDLQANATLNGVAGVLGTPGSRHFPVGTRFVCRDDTNGVLVGPTLLVSSVTNRGRIVVTDVTGGNPDLSAIATAIAAGRTVRAYLGQAATNLSRDNELVGMLSHVNDDTGTYQALSRNTIPEIRATRLANGGVARDWTDQVLMEGLHAGEELGDGRTDFILAHHSVWRNFVFNNSSAYNDIRHLPRKQRAGIDVLTFSDIETGELDVYRHRFCPYNTAFLLDFSTFRTLLWQGWEFRDETGSVLIPASDAGGLLDSYTAVLTWYGNIFCDDPRNNVRIEDLSATGELL